MCTVQCTKLYSCVQYICMYLKCQYGVKKLAHYFTVHTPTMINIFHSFPLFTGKVAKHKCKWHIYIICLKTVFFCICYHLLSKHLIQLNIFCQFFNKPNRFCPPTVADFGFKIHKTTPLSNLSSEQCRNTI